LGATHHTRSPARDVPTADATNRKDDLPAIASDPASAATPSGPDWPDSAVRSARFHVFCFLGLPASARL